MRYTINLKELSIVDFSKLISNCYNDNFSYYKIYNLYIFNINGEYIKGPISFILFNSHNEYMIKQLYIKVHVEMNNKCINKAIICITNLEDYINN